MGAYKKRFELLKLRMLGQDKIFRFGSVAKIFLCGLTIVWFTVFNPIHAETFFLRASWLALALLFGWGVALCFTTKITTDDSCIRFEAAHLLPTSQLRWEEIGRVKLDSGGTHDAPGLNMYILLPRDRKLRKAIFFGSWIANYKQLLREILERVPPDTKIDSDIFHVVQRHGEETIQHTARAIVLKQQTRHS